MKIWGKRQPVEYKIFEWESIDGLRSLEEFLNDLSKDGWETFQTAWPFPNAWKCFVYARRKKN